jgi:hypothetical protein
LLFMQGVWAGLCCLSSTPRQESRRLRAIGGARYGVLLYATIGGNLDPEIWCDDPT